jgi:cation diffusion facilitator family transporter
MKRITQIINAREKEIYRTTIIGSIVNFILLLFKFVAGVVGHSSAMIADAVHSLSDFATDVIVMVFVRISGKPQDAGHEYGHGKFETLATAIIGILLFITGLGIMFNGSFSIYRYMTGETLPEPGILALIAAIISIIFKETLFHYTILKGRKLNSKAVIANAWHHRSDAFSSIATAIGIGGSIFFGVNMRILDPIAAIIVSFLILRSAIFIIQPAIDELLEKSLPKDIEKEIIDTIMSVDGVSAPHHLRTRRIGNNYAIEVHVRMPGEMSLFEVHTTATEIERRLHDKYGAGTHIGIHMEPLK